MTVTPDATAAPAPMEGAGAYNRASRVQASGIRSATAAFVAAAMDAAIPGGDAPVVIADYGASQGRNSLAPIGAALAALRSRTGPDRPVSVVHTDLPGNDFTSLFRTIEDDPLSYLRSDPATFAFAIGRSFYGQILPAASVLLGWSSWAVQWLSRPPCPIPDQVQVAWSRDAEARRAFEVQAAADWRSFLAHRAAELVPGGRLVVLTMALDQTGDFGYRPLLEALYAGLGAMVADGFIAADEKARMVIPTVGRSREDLLLPFAEGAFAGLRVVSAEVFLEEDHIHADYLADRDAVRFGARWAAFSRASVFPSLAAALGPGGAAGRSAAFIARLEADLASRLAAAPVEMKIPLATVHLGKAG